MIIRYVEGVYTLKVALGSEKLTNYFWRHNFNVNRI